jgi:DNA-binding CsgD family transcriptional regulator
MSSRLIVLTEREREVMQLIMQGYTNRQIARVLGIAEHTIEKHLSNMYRKLEVTNRTSAVLRFLGVSHQVQNERTGNPL